MSARIRRDSPPGSTCSSFALVAGAIYSRRPDALLNPQFYAEDGLAWFADAWNLGWLHSLTLPTGGYLNTLPRLVCGLPVNILLTSRCSNWGPLWIRGLQAALYVMLPNSREIHVTITNTHWHLALAACLIGFSNTPHSWTWQLFDVIVLLLVGLTGPWALVLTPLVFFSGGSGGVADSFQPPPHHSARRNAQPFPASDCRTNLRWYGMGSEFI